MDLKVGILSKEYFGFKNKTEPTNYHGGFGFLTRKKAEELAKQNVEVHVFVPRYSFDGINNKNLNLVINKVNIHFLKTRYNPFSDHSSILNDLVYPNIIDRDILNEFKRYDLDLFHSEDPFIFSIIASKLNKPHVKIFQDPFDSIDKEVMKQSYIDYILKPDIYNPNFVTEAEVRKKYFDYAHKYYTKHSFFSVSDQILARYIAKEPRESIFTEANFISKKLRDMFNLKFVPETLYNPIDIPKGKYNQKSSQPSIIFLGRFEEQKRPDVALAIAKKLHEYKFYFVGMPSPKQAYIKEYNKLKRLYKKYKNIHFLGFIEEKQKLELLSSSWILLNTSVREGLPISFLEAGAYGNAIVSSLNQEGYPSLFGDFVKDKNFETAIRELVNSEKCLAIGKTAHKYIKRHHATPYIIRKTIKVYKSVLE